MTVLDRWNSKRAPNRLNNRCNSEMTCKIENTARERWKAWTTETSSTRLAQTDSHRQPFEFKYWFQSAMALSASKIGNGHHRYALPILPLSLNSQEYLCAETTVFMLTTCLYTVESWEIICRIEVWTKI